MTYKALSINSDNKLVESPTSVAMRSPEVTVVEFVPMSVAVNKVWDSSASNYMQDVTIRLWADGQEVDHQTLNAENRWTYTWEDLSKYDENENEIEYKITEDDLGRYFYQDIKNEGNVWTITNSYAPVYTSVSVNKVWDDDDNAAGARPTSINVEILKGGSVYATVTLNDANSWSYSSDRILDDGSEWSVSEVEVPENYVSSVSGADGVFTIINTYTVHTLGSIVVNKTSTGATTPADATFQLQKMEGDEWINVGEPVAYSAFVENAYTFTELEEGTYRIVESGAEVDGYTLETTYSANVVLSKTTAANGDTSVNSNEISVTNAYVAIEEEPTVPEETVPEETEPEDNIEIPEEDVPLASAPVEEEEEDIIEIPDEDVPMADVPKTGDLILPFIGMVIASGAATIFVGKTGKKKEDEE